MTTAELLQREAHHVQSLALGDWLDRTRGGQRPVESAFGHSESTVRSWPFAPAAATAPAAPSPGDAQGTGPGEQSGPCPRCEAVVSQAELERRELLDALREPYVHAATALGRATAELQGRFAQDVLQLASRLAERVVGRAVELDSEAVLRSLDRALDAAGPIERMTIVCHPDDVALLEEHASERATEGTGHLAHIVVRAGKDVQRGGCVVRFEEGTVDARLETQLEELSQAVARAVMDPSAARSGGSR